MTSWSWCATSRSTRSASTTCCLSWAGRTWATCPASGSWGCRSSRAWSITSRTRSRCRSASRRRSRRGSSASSRRRAWAFCWRPSTCAWRSAAPPCPARARSPLHCTAWCETIRGRVRSSWRSQEGLAMHDTRAFVIVGGGLAGGKAVDALREEGYEGPIALFADEAELPYERPPLSKEYLRGEVERDKPQVHPADFYEQQGVDLRLGTRVEQLDTGAREVELSDGQRVAYERLLLATGAEPRRLPVPGGDLDGV